MSDKDYKYGCEGKTISFVDDDKRHADLKIRLRHDGLTQTEFFQFIVTGYLNNDERIVNFVSEVKERLAKQGKVKIFKTKSMILQGESLATAFSLTDKEKDEIFDMISEERIDS